MITKDHKIIIWHALVALLSWQVWSSGRSASFNPIIGLNFQTPAVGGFIVLTSIIILGYILFQSKIWPYTIAGIVSLSFLIFYGFTALNSIGILIFFIFVWHSNERVHSSMADHMKLNISRMLYTGLYPFIVGFLVLVSFAAYQSPSLNQIKDANKLPSQSLVLFQQIAEKVVGSNLDTATSQERKQALNQIASQALQKANAWLEPYFQYAPPLLAFGLFLILWGLSFLFVWAGVGVGLVWFWLLKKTKMVRIEEKDVKAEVLIV